MPPKNKGIYKLFRTKQELEIYENHIRHHSRVFMLDHVTIALGRLGWEEEQFREFDKMLKDVVAEYMDDYSTDYKCDREMVYSRKCLDREMRQYVGSLFVPEEERYR